MQNQYIARYDTQDRPDSAGEAHVRPGVDTHAMSALPADGLFSHPDADRSATEPDSQPDEDSRSYTGLFREPADTPQDTNKPV